MAVDVTLNGEEVSLPDEAATTLADLVQTRLLRPDRIAIERNGEIAPRSTWPTVVLASGDRIEVVHFVGGGSTRCFSSASH